MKAAVGMSLTIAALIVAPLVIAPLAQAQPAPAAGKTQVSDFVQSFAGPLWNTERICIWVDGPDEAQADQVKARVDADARAAGLSVKRACTRWQAQVEIIFAPDAGKAVGQVLNNHHNPVWPFPMETPTGADRPIKAWYGLRYDFANAPEGTPRNLGANPSVRKKLDLAIVVVDPRRTQGLGLDAVADYAALLALSQPHALDRCNVLPSVTDLYAGACPGRAPPTGLTAADTAYLKALYTGSPEIRATRYRSEFVDHVAKLLGGSGTAAG